MKRIKPLTKIQKETLAICIRIAKEGRTPEMTDIMAGRGVLYGSARSAVELLAWKGYLEIESLRGHMSIVAVLRNIDGTELESCRSM